MPHNSKSYLKKKKKTGGGKNKILIIFNEGGLALPDGNACYKHRKI